MQIVIPMAGQGERFTKAGFKAPKPLLEIDGKLMIEYVTNLFPKKSDFIYICNTKDMQKHSIGDVLKHKNPKSKIFAVKFQKKGPVYSVLQIERMINDNTPAIVNYCDFNMKWDFKVFEKYVISEDLDGAIVCYRGFHPHLLGPNFYASVLTDKKNNFLEIKEKHSFTVNKMDSWQSCGTYYFKTGKVLKKYFKLLINKKIDHNNEYYVSMVYNLMHSDGLKIKVYPIEKFCQWGTPEDLEEYLYWSRLFRI